jgi:hypothetical protein
MSDDLTIAYLLGVEDMRSKLHKQADQIERLRAENEKLHQSQEQLGLFFVKIGDRGYYVCEAVWKEIVTLREALKPFADAVLKDEYSWKYDINNDDFRAAAAAIRESGG